MVKQPQATSAQGLLPAQAGADSGHSTEMDGRDANNRRIMMIRVCPARWRRMRDLNPRGWLGRAIRRKWELKPMDRLRLQREAQSAMMMC
jgi:hypothetical protein